MISKEKRMAYTNQAREIVESLTLEQKVSLMSGTESLEQMIHDLMGDQNKHYNHKPYPAGGIEEEGVPPMLFCDGPRGVVCGTGKSTCFPVSMLRGATFDIDLEERVGRAIGKESRAYGGNLFAGVCINLPYNPGWGRSQETYGEESFLLGQMGSALVRGVQDEGVIACLKHYAFNSMEIARFKVSVTCDRRTEREVYLQHFKDCIDAGAASVMSSYNLYQGLYCGHHDYLLNRVLKEEWGFDGFVMSDFVWGVNDTVDAANGGQDMEMCVTQFYGDKLVDAVKNDKVPESRINDAAVRIIRTLLSFKDMPVEAVNESVLASKEHVALALEAAEKGMTLLQNNHQVLPLDAAKTKKIAVIGKLAKKEGTGDHGSSRVFPPYVVTPLQGIIKAVPDADVIYYDGEDIDHAKKVAKDADAVIFVVGYDHDDEGEFVSESQTDAYTGSMGGDRVDSLGLHRDEVELLQQVGPVNEISVAYLIGGNMIMISEWQDKISSIIMGYYAGMEGGTAFANILFGKTNPSGKTPFVIPHRESDLPQVDWDADKQHYHYYHGYAKLEKEGIEPLIPFGYGLSYTKFDVKDASFGVENDQVFSTCKVSNNGDRDGDEVVQLYIGFKNSQVDRPVKLLRGFKRVSLKAGESKDVKISCPIERLRWYNPAICDWELEAMDYEFYIGTSSANKDLLEGTITLS